LLFLLPSLPYIQNISIHICLETFRIYQYIFRIWAIYFCEKYITNYFYR